MANPTELQSKQGGERKVGLVLVFLLIVITLPFVISAYSLYRCLFTDVDYVRAVLIVVGLLVGLKSAFGLNRYRAGTSDLPSSYKLLVFVDMFMEGPKWESFHLFRECSDCVFTLLGFTRLFGFPQFPFLYRVDMSSVCSLSLH